MVEPGGGEIEARGFDPPPLPAAPPPDPPPPVVVPPPVVLPPDADAEVVDVTVFVLLPQPAAATAATAEIAVAAAMDRTRLSNILAPFPVSKSGASLSTPGQSGQPVVEIGSWPGTELRGAAEELKGKAKDTAGRARCEFKKATR